MQIEVNLMPGKGDFLLTGQLGDVMKESAQTGISYIRSVAEKYHIDADFLKSMIYIFIFRKALCRRMDHPQVLPWQQPCFLP